MHGPRRAATRAGEVRHQRQAAPRAGDVRHQRQAAPRAGAYFIYFADFYSKWANLYGHWFQIAVFRIEIEKFFIFCWPEAKNVSRSAEEKTQKN